MKDRKFYFSMTIQGNTKQEDGTNDTRTVQPETVSKTITVRQFDEASEYFNPINSEGIGVTKPSTEYNHSCSMGDEACILGIYAIDRKVFQYCTRNVNGTVCHIIGHKQIYTNASNNISYNTNGGNDNDRYLGVFEGSDRIESIGGFSDTFSSGLRTDVSVGNVYFDSRKNRVVVQKTLNSDGANNTVCMRSLVIVDIRGTSTNRDWLTDFVGTHVGNNISHNVNGGNDNGSLGSIEKTIGGKSNGSFNDDSQSDLWTDVSVGNVGSNYNGNSKIFRKTLNLGNTSCIRTLVVVDIRGSSTNQDWLTDFVGTHVSNNISYNANGGNNNGYMGILEGTGGCKSTGVISVSSSLWTNDSVDNIWSNHRRNSEIFWNTLNLYNTDCMRTLVVVDIRGLSTNRGWLTDFVGTHVSNNISYNANGGNDNGTLGILEGTGKHGTIGYFSDDFQSGLRTDVSMDNTGMYCGRYSEAFWKALNSDGANNTDCMRTLVVVDIRGSSTTQDWWTDIGSEFGSSVFSFETGMNMVLKSLYHGTGNTENCTKCNGKSGGCEYCKGYIPFNNISNPIFLVTGHSLGAAFPKTIISSAIGEAT